NSIHVVSSRDVCSNSGETSSHLGKPGRQPDILFGIGAPERAAISISNSPFRMLEQHVARIARQRLWHRPALPFDSGRPAAQSIEVGMHLQPVPMTFTNRDLEGII